MENMAPRVGIGMTWAVRIGGSKAVGVTNLAAIGRGRMVLASLFKTPVLNETGTKEIAFTEHRVEKNNPEVLKCETFVTSLREVESSMTEVDTSRLGEMDPEKTMSRWEKVDTRSKETQLEASPLSRRQGGLFIQRRVGESWTKETHHSLD